MSKQTSPHTVIVRVQEFIEPQDVLARYETPIANFLSERNYGRVRGSSSQRNEKYRIVSVDIELELSDLSAALTEVQQLVESLGVPAGSELRFVRNGTAVNRRIGKLETSELILSMAGLSPEAYEQLDFHAFYETLRRSLAAAGAGEPRGVWSGPEETSVFIIGKSAVAVQKVLTELLPTEVLLKGSRLVISLMDPRAKPLEVRL